MKSKEKILAEFQERLKITQHGLRPQWKHIESCRAFYAGDYMNYQDTLSFGRGSSQRIKEVSFNRVKPYVNSIVGFFSQQRRKPDYQAVTPDQKEQVAYSEYLNGYSDYIRDNTNADQKETRQDLDMVIGGVGVTDTAITLKMGEATRDPNGEIVVERVDPLQTGWDPASVEAGLTDSRWVYRTKEYDVDEAEALFNADEEEFESANPMDDINNYQFNPYGGIQDKIGYEWVDSNRQMVRVYFYQWHDIEPFFRVENPLFEVQNPEMGIRLAAALSEIEQKDEDEMFRFNPQATTLCITKDKRAEVKKIFEDFGFDFNHVKDKRKVYYTAVISGDRVFQAYRSVSQQGFTLKFKTGDRDEINKIWTGIVASLRDPQRYYNKALTELMLIIANNSRGGVMYEEDAVDNVAEFESKWAKTNSAVRVNAGAISGGKIKEKATPHMNTGYEGVMAESSNAMSLVTGIDESFFGAIAGGNETAMLQRQRIKQATTSLALYIDAINLYAKDQARMMLSFMRMLAESARGSYFSMYDDNGDIIYETLAPEFFMDEYQIRIGEAPETHTQKEYYTQTLLTMAQNMQAIGDPRYTQMYAAAVRYMPLPQRDKNMITQILTGEQQIDPSYVKQLEQTIEQLRSPQMQMEMEKIIADVKNKAADTSKKLVDIEKTLAEAEEIKENTESKAIENDIMAVKPLTDVNVNI